MEDDTIKVLNLKIHGADPDEVLRYTEILDALLKVGALSGVKNGAAVIHFDENATFVGIELRYWPWRRRKSL